MLSYAKTGLEASVAPGGTLTLAGVRLRLTTATQALNIGPAQLQLTRASDAIETSFTAGGTEQQAPLSLRLRLPTSAAPIAIDLTGGPVSLAALGVKEGDFGLKDVAQAELSARVSSVLAPLGESISVSGTGTVRGASIHHPRLSRQPVRGIEFRWRASGELAFGCSCAARSSS
jgi:hypothetical protein